MKKAGIVLFLCFTLSVLAAVYPNGAYAWLKAPINDVDKPGVPPGPPNPNDMSCWLATAANMLSSAGWGDAVAIYGTLLNQFGSNNPGWAHVALQWYIQNAANPGTPFTVVSWYWWGQNPAQVNPTFIADELRRCQYVGIGIFPTISGSGDGHCITAWGDELPQNRDGLNPATVNVTDSDRDVGNGLNGTDVYNWVQDIQSGKWGLQNYYQPGNGWLDYVCTLCPVPEPASFVALFTALSAAAALAYKRK